MHLKTHKILYGMHNFVGSQFSSCNYFLRPMQQIVFGTKVVYPDRSNRLLQNVLQRLYAILG